MSSLSAGTIGSNNWRYTVTGPLFIKEKVAGLNEYTVYLNPEELGVDLDELSQNQLESMYNGYTSSYQFNYYKMGVLEEYYNITDEYEYKIYANINGETKRIGSIAGHNGIFANPFSSVYKFGLYETIKFATLSIPATKGKLNFPSFLPKYDDLEKMEREWLKTSSTESEGSEDPSTKDVPDPIVGISSLAGVVSDLYVIANIDVENLDTLATILSAGWQTGNIREGVLFSKIIAYPTNASIPVGSSETLINPLGRYSVSGRRFTRFQSEQITIGSFLLQERFGNFIDYSRCEYKIYLPFAGMYSLDPSLVVNANLTLTCSIDFSTGEIAYYLKVNDSVIYSFNGNCSIDIPITYEDYGRKVAIVGNTAAQAAAAILSKGATAPMLVGSATSLENATDYTSSGCLRSNIGFSSILYPYIIIKKPKPNVPENYTSVIGGVCNESGLLGTFNGFTKVKEVHVDIEKATNEEKNMIDNLLKEGVIL